jgi:hypothetical protein
LPKRIAAICSDRAACWQEATGNKLIDNNTVSSVLTARTASYPATSNRTDSITQNSSGFRNYVHNGAGNIVTDVQLP